MPVQRTLCGLPVGVRMPPRRFQLLFVFALLFVTTVLVFGASPPTALPTYEQVKEAVKDSHMPTVNVELPSVPNVFGPSPHKPPAVQANSTANSAYGAITWLTDFKWHNPFSKEITLDENRAVLPPLADRPLIFTFYEPKPKQDKHITEAENRLVLAWRKAWWAQGFRPQVLSRDEAMKNSHYDFVQRMKLEPKVETDFMRWLAWGYMARGDAILANYLTLPMAAYDNPMLSFLRRGEYPQLSRVESLHDAIFFGEDAAINAAIRKAVQSDELKNVTANKDKIAKLAQQDGGILVNLLPKEDITADTKANGLAHYSYNTIKENYKTVAEKLTNDTRVQGLDLLADLINSHLHLTFQELHADGVAVVKPLPDHTTALTYEAIEIARNLTQCPSTPLPKSCPPNRPKCTPCDPNKPTKFQLMPSYKNDTTLYSIGSVPHPYTLTSLHYEKDNLDATFIRKETRPNAWLHGSTKQILGEQHTELYRVLFFKDAVASLRKASHSLWLTAERATQTDLEWVFGFNLPQQASPNAEPNSPSEGSELIIFPRPRDPTPIPDLKLQEDRWVRKEEERLKSAREVLQKREDNTKDMIKTVEDWNPFDFEAWQFARAFSARRRVEREVWEQEEKKYAGSERKAGIKAGGAAGGRWSDKI